MVDKNLENFVTKPYRRLPRQWGGFVKHLWGGVKVLEDHLKGLVYFILDKLNEIGKVL